MIARVFAVALALLAFALAPAAAQAPFRVAFAAGADAPCSSPTAAQGAGAAAYAAHLAGRLERPVLLCPRNDANAAARLLAAGGADFAMLTPEAFREAGAARAVLAPRLPQDYGRVPMVASVLAQNPAVDLAALRGKRAVLGGEHPVAAEGPFRALADYGLPREAFAAVEQAGTPELAIARLRANAADVMLLHASAHRRLCRAIRPEDQPCADLRTIWTARPRATLALAAPLSLPDELRYRLIAVHIALHLEAPQAFAWIAPPGATSFDPAEAGALTLAR